MANIYLYDPISNTKQKTNYELLSGITGQTINSLQSYKSRKNILSRLGRYIVDDNFTQKDLYELMCRQKLKDEIWKDVYGSNGKYQVSNYGRIRKVLKNGNSRLLMPYIRKNKWLCVKVNVHGKVKEFTVHRLVAIHFIKNEHELPYVYHKNDDIYDNHADNLAWIDRKSLGKKTAHKAKAMPVLKIDPSTGEVLDEYVSMAEAGKFNYLHRETIRLCVNGRLKTAGGYKWMYADWEGIAL